MFFSLEIKVFYHFPFHAFGDFIFLRAQKNEAKKGRPCGGLHSANRFWGSHDGRWPANFGSTWEWVRIGLARCAGWFWLIVR